MQNCKVSRDLNPPIESKLSRDNLDSIGGFKSRDTLQFCIPSLDEASNLKNTVCAHNHNALHFPLKPEVGVKRDMNKHRQNYVQQNIYIIYST